MGETKQTLVDILDADEDYIRVDECTDLSFTGYEDDPHNGVFPAEDVDSEWVIATFWGLDRFSLMEPFVYKVEDRVYIHKDLVAVKNVINNTFDVLVEVVHYTDYIWRLEVRQLSYSDDRLQVVIGPERDSFSYLFWITDGPEFQELLQEYETNENDWWKLRDERYPTVWDYLTRNKMEKWLRYRSPRDRFSNGEADTIRKKWIQQRQERHGDIVVPILQASEKHIPKELLSLISNLENPTPKERKGINDRERMEALEKHAPFPGDVIGEIKKYVPGHKSSKRRKTKLRF